MDNDFFEKLADAPVPPPPASFDTGLHARINRQLLVGHLLDFTLQAVPFAIVHFARAVGALAVTMISGKFTSETRGQGDRAP